MSDARANIVITSDPRNAQQGLKAVQGSLGELQAAQKKLTEEFKNVARGTQEFADKAKQLKDVNKQISSIQDSVRGTSGSLKEFALGFSPIGLSAGAAAAGLSLFARES